MKTFPAIKDPEDVKDYGIDWTKTLDGDAITSSDWSVVTGDVTIDSEDIAGPIAIVWLSGGSCDAILQNTITTDHARTYHRQALLKVQSL